MSLLLLVFFSFIYVLFSFLLDFKSSSFPTKLRPSGRQKLSEMWAELSRDLNAMGGSPKDDTQKQPNKKLHLPKRLMAKLGQPVIQKPEENKNKDKDKVVEAGDEVLDEFDLYEAEYL